jgi:hypothetical protein
MSSPGYLYIICGVTTTVVLHWPIFAGVFRNDNVCGKLLVRIMSNCGVVKLILRCCLSSSLKLC